MKNYNDTTIVDNLVSVIEEARKGVSTGDFFMDLIQEAVDYIKDNCTPANDEEAAEAMNSTGGGLWKIISANQHANIASFTDKDIDPELRVSFYVKGFSINSPVAAASYYLQVRSAHFLIDAVWATFKQDPAKTTEENIDKLIDTIKNRKF